MQTEDAIKEFSTIRQPELSKTNSQFRRDEKVKIDGLYKFFFGDTSFKKSRCRSCYIDAWVSIRAEIKKIGASKPTYIQLIQNTMATEKKEGKFKLKEKKQIMMHGLGDVITNDNLTDEKAYDLLRKQPKLIKFFDRYPEDWQGGSAAPAGGDADPAGEGDSGNGGGEFTAETYREELENSSKKQLQEICESNEESFGPKKTWEKLNKGQLVEYMVEQKFPS